MSKTPEADSPRINPFYETDWPNHPINLTTEHASLISTTARSEEGKEFVAHGTIKVVMHWSPIRFDFEFEGEMLQGYSSDDETEELNFSYLGGEVRIEAETFQTLGYVTADRDDGVDGVIDQNEITCGTEEKLQTVTFHLANYTEISSSQIVRDREPGDFGPVRDYSEIELEADGWRILLQPHRWTRELNWDAEKDVGNILNGIGQITRANGEEFTVSSGRMVIDALDYFLSFVFNQRMPLMLCVGSNSTESRSWQLWRRKNVQYVYGHKLKTWVPVGGGDQLSTAFTGFYDKWNDPSWHEPLKISIDWLLNADMQGEEDNIRGAIAFSQIPFEMLAWAKKAANDSNSAAKKIEKLLVQCEVSTATPSECKTLQKLEQRAGFRSGPALIVEARNCIIHPTKERLRQLSEWEEKSGISCEVVFGEVFKLFQHYLLLILLHTIGYEGCYKKRLGGSTEDIISDCIGHRTPWSTEEDG